MTGILVLLALAGGAPANGARATPPAAEPAAKTELQRAIDQLGGEAATRRAARRVVIAGGAAAVPLLVARSDHPATIYRWEVVNALGAIGAAEAVPALVERVLADSSPHVRWRALWALGSVSRSGEEARRRFTGELQAADRGRRWNAAVGLAYYGDERALSSLHDGLKSESGWVRWEAANALQRVHDERSSGQLAEFLERERSVGKAAREAILALGLICDARAREVLVATLEVADAQLRWRAALGLGRCADPATAEALRQRLAVEKDAVVRSSLSEALGKIAR
jgi:hypothetical protein